MSVWFTSDLHIGHAKVAEMRGFKHEISDNPSCTLCHDSWLGRRWDDLVDDDDQVWVLGDISSGTKRAQINALNWIMERPGTKHLIAGNHDGCHPMHRDSHKWLPIYLDGSFETVQMAARRKISWNGGSSTVLLSHFPYSGDHTEEDRHTQWRLPDEGDYILHGHVHNSDKLSVRWTTKPQEYVARQIHVGVDAWDFKPVRLDEIVKLVNEH